MKRRSRRKNKDISTFHSVVTSGSKTLEMLFPKVSIYNFRLPLELKEGEYERTVNAYLDSYYGSFSTNRCIISTKLKQESKMRISSVISPLVRDLQREIEKVYRNFPDCYVFNYLVEENDELSAVIKITNPDLSYASIGYYNYRHQIPPEMEIEYKGKMVNPKDFQMLESDAYIETPCFSVKFDTRLSSHDRISKILSFLDYYPYLGIYRLNRDELKNILNELEEGKRNRKVEGMLKRARKMPEYSGLETWISAEFPDTAKALAREMV